MPRTKREDRWVTGKEATEILRKNSNREDIPDTYIRSLARIGKVETKELDGRTNLYRLSDFAHYVVKRRDQGKGRRRTRKQEPEQVV